MLPSQCSDCSASLVLCKVAPRRCYCEEYYDVAHRHPVFPCCPTSGKREQ